MSGTIIDLQAGELESAVSDAHVSAAPIVVININDEIERTPDLTPRHIDWLSSPARTVIAVASGPLIGNGITLALSCDLFIASPSATFDLAVDQTSQFPAKAAFGRLVQRVSRSQVLALTLTGEIGAQRALSLGLIDLIASPEELESVLRTLSSADAGWLAEFKALLNQVEESQLERERISRRVQEAVVRLTSQTEEPQ